MNMKLNFLSYFVIDNLLYVMFSLKTFHDDHFIINITHYVFPVYIACVKAQEISPDETVCGQ